MMILRIDPQEDTSLFRDLGWYYFEVRKITVFNSFENEPTLELHPIQKDKASTMIPIKDIKHMEVVEGRIDLSV